MFVLLAFFVVSSVFIVAAILVADVLMARWVARQDVVWRVTLIAICLLPVVLYMRPWLSTGAMSIRVPIEADDYSLTGSRAANFVVPPTMATHEAPVMDESDVATLPLVSAPAEARSSVVTSPQVTDPETESACEIADRRISGAASVGPRTANRLNWISIAASFFATLWAAGTLFRVTALCGGYWQLRNRTQTAVGDPDSRWQKIADELSTRGSSASLQVRFCSSSSTPAIGRFLGGIVLIPESMKTINDDTMIRQILIHERTHLVRGDQWFNLLLHSVGAVLWIHPLYYWMKRRILWLREVICDASVVQEFSAVQYSQTLLELSRRNANHERNAIAVAMATPRSMLGKRVTFLLSLSSVEPLLRTPAVTRRIGWLVAAAACAMIGLVQFTSAAQQSAADDGRTTAPTQAATEKAATATTHSLSGVITLPDGKAAAMATVYLLAVEEGSYTLPTHPAVTQTNDAGKYTFQEVKPGKYRVWAELANFTSLEKFLGGKSIEIQNPKDAESSIDLALHDGCRYAVKVIDAKTREGIANAEIKFGWTDIERKYTTNADGLVELGGLAKNDWYFVVQAADYAVNYRKIPAQPLGSRMELTFEMAPGGIVSGTVLDEKGEPVVGASVHASATAGSMTPGLGKIVTDANGKYELKSMPIQEEIELSLSLDGFNRSRKTITVPADQRSVALNLEMKRRPPGGDCILTVTDEDGKPVAGATVFGDGGYSAEERTFTTDEKGVAVMKDLPATFQGHRGGVRGKGLIPKEFQFVLGNSAQPGEVSVVLEKGESIRGRLLDPNGKPADGITVYFNGGEYGGGDIVGGRAKTDQEGRFQLDGLPDPSTFTFYTKPPFAPINRRELPVGTDEEIIVKMESEAVIRVRAVDSETGDAIPEFNVRVAFSPDRRASDPDLSGLASSLIDPGTDILGAVKEFRLGHLPEGAALQVTVSAKGYDKSVLRRMEAVVESESESLDVELFREDETLFSTVSGVLKDSAGKPVSGATLKLVVGSQSPLAGAPGFIGFRVQFDNDVVNERDWRFYNWHSVESGNIKSDPQCLQFLTATSGADGTFSFPHVRRAPWMEVFYKDDRVANGRHVIDDSQEAENLKDIEIEAPLPGSVKVIVDLEAFPEAHSVEIAPEQERTSNAAFESSTRNLPKAAAEVNFAKLPPGFYRVTLQGPHEPLSNDSGGYSVRPLSSTTVEVIEDEASDVEF